MNKGEVDIITMGCSKNLVDSEVLMYQFERNGYRCFHDPANTTGEIVVVNTCGFIGDAKDESIKMILKMAKAKEKGNIGKLFVMGCLSERYREELTKEIPEVDGFYGKFDYLKLLTDLGKTFDTCEGRKRHLTTPKHYAYLKISEGCDRRCSYCAIPLITGHHVSRPIREILTEVENLVAQGVKEFHVIAQELTYYGVDIDGKQHIAELISRMADINGVEWIRLHYAYPNQFPWELTDVMKKKKNVCNYLDIALQHISDHMLNRMHRHITKAETIEFINRLRASVPGICLRTTLMVGFPGETEEDFQELMEFVRWARFDRMGAFAYSEEEGTYSALYYQDDVGNEIKQQRLDQLMALQQKISSELEAEMIGRTLKVIIDRKESDYYIGRTEYSSPEVDPEVLIPATGKRLKIGHFYMAKITDAEEFDLYAEVVS